jgi:uncharacterized protein (DUF924 family)
MAATSSGQTTAQAVHAFWFEEATPEQWFVRDPAFDKAISERFGAAHQAACETRLDDWQATVRGALALILLLDQFSRNIYRDDARAFAQDALALEATKQALARGFDQHRPDREKAFFYMPFMHSENLTVQEQSVALFKANQPASDNLRYAIGHHEIIAQFGRFPHRNQVLGRASTPEEIAYLDAGGFNP